MTTKDPAEEAASKFSDVDIDTVWKFYKNNVPSVVIYDSFMAGVQWCRENEVESLKKEIALLKAGPYDLATVRNKEAERKAAGIEQTIREESRQQTIAEVLKFAEEWCNTEAPNYWHPERLERVGSREDADDLNKALKEKFGGGE